MLSSPLFTGILVIGTFLGYLFLAIILVVLSLFINSYVLGIGIGLLLILIGRFVAHIMVFPPSVPFVARMMIKEFANNYYYYLSYHLRTVGNDIDKQRSLHSTINPGTASTRTSSKSVTASYQYLVNMVNVLRFIEHECVLNTVNNRTHPISSTNTTHTIPSSIQEQYAHASLLRHYLDIVIVFHELIGRLSTFLTNSNTISSSTTDTHTLFNKDTLLQIFRDIETRHSHHTSYQGNSRYRPLPLSSTAPSSDWMLPFYTLSSLTQRYALVLHQYPPYLSCETTQYALLHCGQYVQSLPSVGEQYTYLLAIQAACIEILKSLTYWTKEIPHIYPNGRDVTKRICEVYSLPAKDKDNALRDIQRLRIQRIRKGLGILGGGRDSDSVTHLPHTNTVSSTLNANDTALLLGIPASTLLSVRSTIATSLPNSSPSSSSSFIASSSSSSDVPVPTDEDKLSPAFLRSDPHENEGITSTPEQQQQNRLNLAFTSLMNSTLFGRFLSLLRYIKIQLSNLVVSSYLPAPVCDPLYVKYETILESNVIPVSVPVTDDDNDCIDIYYFPNTRSPPYVSPPSVLLPSRSSLSLHGSAASSASFLQQPFPVVSHTPHQYTYAQYTSLARRLSLANIPHSFTECFTGDRYATVNHSYIPSSLSSKQGTFSIASENTRSGQSRESMRLPFHQRWKFRFLRHTTTLLIIVANGVRLLYRKVGAPFLYGLRRIRKFLFSFSLSSSSSSFPSSSSFLSNPQITSRSPGVVLYCGPNAGMMDYSYKHNQWITTYLNMGYDVCVWRYRGYGKYTNSNGKFTCRPSLLRKDGLRVAQYLMDEVQARTLIVHGESLGGIAACAIAETAAHIMNYGIHYHKSEYQGTEPLRVAALVTDRTFDTLPRTSRKLVGFWAEYALALLTGWERSNGEAYLHSYYSFFESKDDKNVPDTSSSSASSRMVRIIATDTQDEIIHWEASLACEVSQRIFTLPYLQSLIRTAMQALHTPVTSSQALQLAEEYVYALHSCTAHTYFLLTGLAKLSYKLFAVEEDVYTFSTYDNRGTKRKGVIEDAYTNNGIVSHESLSTASTVTDTVSTIDYTQNHSLLSYVQAMHGNPDAVSSSSLSSTVQSMYHFLYTHYLTMHPQSLAYDEVLAYVYGESIDIGGGYATVNAICKAVTMAATATCTKHEERINERRSEVQEKMKKQTNDIEKDAAVSSTTSGTTTVASPIPTTTDIAEWIHYDTYYFSKVLMPAFGSATLFMVLGGITNGIGHRLGETSIMVAESSSSSTPYRDTVYRDVPETHPLLTFFLSGMVWGWSQKGLIQNQRYYNNPQETNDENAANTSSNSIPCRTVTYLNDSNETGIETALRRLKGMLQVYDETVARGGMVDTVSLSSSVSTPTELDCSSYPTPTVSHSPPMNRSLLIECIQTMETWNKHVKRYQHWVNTRYVTPSSSSSTTSLYHRSLYQQYADTPEGYLLPLTVGHNTPWTVPNTVELEALLKEAVGIPHGDGEQGR